ncbi:hypothetical protein ACQ4PT_024571 [Festuca glaucescens]
MILFTADMITKVFGIRSGPRPVVLLKRSENHALRDVYRGTSPRPDIPTAIKVLKDCLDTDHDTIIRSWDLLCLATVIDPSSSNHLCMEYVGSMLDPSRTHEYAWDEYILDLAMKEVSKIQKKRDKPLVLEEGSSKFEFWISGPFVVLGFLELSQTPYALGDPQPGVQPEDHHVEVNQSASLNEWLVFPSSQEMEVPDRFKHLHDKHKVLFATDFDVAIKNFAVGAKRIHSQRMSALLNDVDAAMKEADAAPSVVFSPGAAAHVGGNTNGDFVSEQQGAATEGGVPNAEGEVDDIRLEESEDDDTDEGDKERDDEPMHAAIETIVPIVPLRSVVADLPQSTVITDSSCLGGDIGEHQTVDSPARLPFANDEVRCATWNMGIDAPLMELLEEGTNDYEIFVGNKLDTPSRTTPTRTSNDAEVATPTADIPSAETPPDEVCIPATCPVVLEKDVPTVEVVDIVTPSEPKTAGIISIESTEKDATSGFQTHEKKNMYKRAAKSNLTPPKMKKIKVSQDAGDIKEFVRIGRYFCSYKSFFESLKPRHYLDSEVMNVWVEKFNREAKIVAQKNPREKKKYAFTQFMVDKLIVDPAAFDLDSCMKELKLVNAKFKILKYDLLYFPIVKNSHWVICCINSILKQFHIFDSMRSSKDSSLLEQYGLNLFANFNTLVIVSNLSTSNFSEFTLNTPDHPQQTTLFDCGFFSQLFMDNFDAKVMAHFGNNAIPDHRKAVTASLIEARDNGDVVVESVMEEELIKKK